MDEPKKLGVFEAFKFLRGTEFQRKKRELLTEQAERVPEAPPPQPDKQPVKKGK